MPKADERQNKLRPMSFRVSPEMRSALEEAASRNGRSVTNEIEYRLRLSFDQEALVRELAKVLKDT
jgi:hypothetical protein